MPGPFNLRCSVDALLLSPRPVMKLDHDLDMWQVTTGGNAVVLAMPEILIAIDTTCGRGVDSPTATVGRSSKLPREGKALGWPHVRGHREIDCSRRIRRLAGGQFLARSPHRVI